MPVMMTFSRSVERRRIEPRQADGQDRDGDRRLHHLADLEAGVGRGHGEDDAEQGAPHHRAPGHFRWRHAGGDQRHIDFAFLQRLVRVLRKRLRFDTGHAPPPEYGLKRRSPNVACVGHPITCPCNDRRSTLQPGTERRAVHHGTALVPSDRSGSHYPTGSQASLTPSCPLDTGTLDSLGIADGSELRCRLRLIPIESALG